MKHFKITIVAALLLAGNLPLAHAQREAKPREEKRQERRDLIEKMAPEERHKYFENRFNERLKTATPEERDRMLAFRADIEKKMKEAGIDANDPNAWQKMRDAGIMGNRGGGNRAADDAMRQMMIAAGITEKDVQDAIIAYVAEQNKARASLFQLAQTAATALQIPAAREVTADDDGSPEAANAKVATTFDAYQTAVAAEKARQETALKALDEKIHYSTTPRLKSFLTLVGILDNDVLAIGGPAAVFVAPQDPNAAPVQTAMDNG